MTNAEPLTVLVSGAGSIGRRHIQNLEQLGMKSITFCDPHSTEKIEHKGFTDYKEALHAVKPQVVFVCSPTKEHVPQAKIALEQGAHVFIEKPLSHSMDGIDELERIRKDRIVMVGCNMRFHPGPKKVKELIDNNAIGSVKKAFIETTSFLPKWRPEQDYQQSYSADPEQGGVILDCIHEIDLALWYLGEATLRDAKVLPATSIGLAIDGEATVNLTHSSGAESLVHMSFVYDGYKRSCVIEGTLGTIRWEFGGDVVLEGKDEEKEIYRESAGWQLNDMYKAEVAYFIECVQNNIIPFSSLAEGRQALAIALAAKTFL